MGKGERERGRWWRTTLLQCPLLLLMVLPPQLLLPPPPPPTLLRRDCCCRRHKHTHGRFLRSTTHPPTCAIAGQRGHHPHLVCRQEINQVLLSGLKQHCHTERRDTNGWAGR